MIDPLAPAAKDALVKAIVQVEVEQLVVDTGAEIAPPVNPEWAALI